MCMRSDNGKKERGEERRRLLSASHRVRRIIIGARFCEVVSTNSVGFSEKLREVKERRAKTRKNKGVAM